MKKFITPKNVLLGLLIIFFIVVLVLIFVSPLIKEMIENSGREYSWVLANLMKTGLFLREYWYLTLLVFINLSIIFWYLKDKI